MHFWDGRLGDLASIREFENRPKIEMPNGILIPMKTSSNQPQLVGASDCIKIVFPCETSRPSLRTFRQWQANRFFAFHKIGRRTFFDPDEVRAALDRRFKISPADLQ